MDAFPEADVFQWSFNTSSGGMDLPRDAFTNQGSASLLSYVPKSQMDYGTVLCRAANLVGRQVVPCVYHVIPAGKIQCSRMHGEGGEKEIGRREGDREGEREGGREGERERGRKWGFRRQRPPGY